MRGLILAAGEGTRAQKVTESYLKCLFPILHPADSLLEILLTQLLEANISDLVIVGGYRYGELQEFLSKFFSFNRIYAEYILLDARPACFHGPLFSFLRAEPECSSNDHFLLLPADTLFHPRLFPWIASLDVSFSSFPDKIIHLAYTDHLSAISDKTQVITCDSHSQVSNITSYKNWKKLAVAASSSSPKVMIPIILFPSALFPVAHRGVEKGFTQVIQILIDLLREKNDWQIITHHFKAESWVFQDFDVPDDILTLQSYLSSMD